MVFLVCAMEPLLYVYIINEMLDVKDKKAVKYMFTFLLLYGAMLTKQFVSCGIKWIMMSIMFLPLTLIGLVPKIVYKTKKEESVKILLSFYTGSILTDCVIFFLVQSNLYLIS